MIDAITQPFIEFSFMRRALVGCLALSLGAPPIGVFLMLRRMSLMGDAMSHAILPGAAVGYLLAGLSLFAMSLGGFAAGLAVALSAGLVARSTVLREDASLAAFYLASLALGVLIVSVKGSNIDLAARAVRHGARARRPRAPPRGLDLNSLAGCACGDLPSARARMFRPAVLALHQ
jgi:zinc/manganese transport system permease protein